MKQIIKSLMLAVLLLTAGFANAQTHYNLQIGTGTATNNYVPDYILYNYSYTQMLYTAGDVGIDGTIDTIAFQSGTASGQTRTLTIYMAEVGQTTLTNQVSADQFHQVYSGSVSWTSGWTYIPLDTVFDYQDTGSLVIAVIDGTGTWVSSISFLGTTMSDTRSKYIYSDYDTYTLSTSISNSTNFVPNIKLGISSYSTYCAQPSDVAVTNIVSDEATISWTENGDATSWEVIVSDEVVTDFDNAASYTVTGTPSFTVTNLSGNTQYYVYVRAVCGSSSESGWTNAVTFTSACMGVTSVPYTTGFEGIATGNLPNCWQALASGSSSSSTFPSAYVYATNARNGNVYFEFESSTGQTEIAALPEMDNIDGLQLDFYASCMNLNFVLEVGVIENDSDFVVVDTVALTAGSGNNWHDSYYPYTVYFNQYSGSGSRMAMRVTASGTTSYTLMIDDLSVSEIPSCIAPTNFSVAGTGSDWATLGWTDDNGSNWEVIYDSVSFDPDNNSLGTETASTNSITISNLSSGVQYTAYVRTNCGGGDHSAWVGPLTFVPGTYIMEANSTDTFYTCGSAIYDNGGPNGQYTSSNDSYLYVFPTDPTQVLSVSGFSTTEGSYDYVRITDLTTNEVLFYDNSTPDGWTIGPFTTYGGIEIYFHSDGSVVKDGYEIFVSCTDAPTCLPVSNLHVSHLNVDSVVVAWIDTINSGANYNVEYRPAGSTNWNSIVTSDDFLAIDMLTANTTYEIRVTALCGGGDSSVSSSIITARTLASEPVDVLPFICTFEDGSVNAYWTLENGSQTNAWYIGGGVNNGGDSALYISNDNGATNSYSISSTSNVFAYVTVNLESGDYAYSFDWQAYGESSFDYIRAALVPASTDLTAGSLCGFGTSTMPSGCIALDGGSKLNLSNNWTTQLGTVDVPAGTYKLTFMWRNDASSGTMPPAAIDNVQFAANSCPQPSQFTSSADSTEITISWTHGGTETSWVVSDGTTSVVVNDTFYTFTNLTPSTVYSFTVAALCGAGDTSMTIGGTVSTTCGAFALPFIEGFENPATLSCWQILNLDNYANSDWALSQDTPHSGSNCMKTGYNSSSDANDWLVTPELFLPVNATGYYVEWYAMGDSWASDVTHMTVVVLSEDATNNTVSDTIYNAVVTDGWNQYNYNISAYSGQSIQIAFIYNGNYDHGARIDDIFIGAIPTCPQPTVMTAVSGLNDIQVIWNHGGTESAWEVSDGTTTVVVYDTFYTFTGLAAATTYNFTVRAVCSAGDTSYYLNGSFTTLNSLPVTTLPYTCTFAGAEGTAWTLENGSQTNIWVVDTAAHNGNADNYGLYITNDGGASNSYNSSSASVVFAYRTFTLPAGDYAYSFDWRANGESSYDYIRAAMVPVSVDMTAGNNTGWSTSALPAGAISLDGGTKLNLISNWTTQSGEITIPTVGQYNMVFFWRNDGSVGNQPPAAIDNIDFRANTCPAVTGITMTDAGIDYVSVDWTSSASAWQVQYGPSGFTLGSGTTINTSNHPVTISNLDAMTSYDVWVRPVCGAGDTGTWRGAMVSTSFCSNANVVTIGDTANYDAYATTDMPISTYYNYSLCEIIVDSAEMGGPMDIDAVEFYYYSNYTLDDETDIDIYLQPTSKVEFDDEYDAVALASNAIHVFHGSFEDFVPGWNTVVFDTMYPYNGNGNLMLIIKDNSGVYNSSLYFVSVECDGNKTLTYYDDYDNPDATDPSTFDGYNMEVLEERPFMHLISCGAGCPKPNGLTATASETFGSYQFTWNGSVSTYEVALKSATEGVWPAETQITTNSYSVSNLMPATTYTFRVRSVCDDATTSTWATVSFTTDSMPCLTPSDFHVVSTTLTSVTFDWTVNGEETAWRIYVWNTGTQAMTFDVTSHPATISGLAQTTSYNAVVMALCGGSIESDPSETITFTTTECQPVSNANVSNVHDESAVVSWNGDAPSYTIEYGLGDFEQGYGTTVSDITATTYTITGLTPDRSYSVYVRADCDATNYSAWSQRLTFRTTNDGIDDVNGMNLTIYPNPTTDNTTIALSGVSGEVTITIVDLSGRTVKTDSMSCDGDCVKTVEVSGLAEGAYFVRVNGEGINMVKKLVVK